MPKKDPRKELEDLIDEALEALFLEDDGSQISELSGYLEHSVELAGVEQEEVAEYIATGVHDYFTGEEGFIPNAHQGLETKRKEIVPGLELHRKYSFARRLISTLKLVKRKGTEESVFQEELITIDPVQIYSLHLEALIHLFGELASSRGKTNEKALRRVLSYGVAMLIEDYQEQLRINREGITFDEEYSCILLRTDYWGKKRKHWDLQTHNGQELLPQKIFNFCGKNDFYKQFYVLARQELEEFGLLTEGVDVAANAVEYILRESKPLVGRLNERYKQMSSRGRKK